MDFGLRDQVVLVTGSSSGLGRATAVAYGAEGARVAVTYHSDRDGANETAEQVRAAGGEALVTPFTLGDPALEHCRRRDNSPAVGWAACPDQQCGGGNIAPMRGTKFEDVPLERWQGVINAALEGTYLMIQAALPLLRQSDWGRIVNISSDGAIRGTPDSHPTLRQKRRSAV